MTQILVTAPFPDHLMDRISAVASGVVVDQMDLTNKSWPSGRNTSVEVIYAVGRASLPPLEAAPNLRWVQSHWAGTDDFFGSEYWHSDILLTNASGVHAPNMGQYVLAQILAWSNRVPGWLTEQRRGKWPSNRWNKFLPDELRGRTLGILGYGSIGREVARLAKAFHMTVLATKRDGRHVQDTGYTIPGAGDPEGKMVDRIYPAGAERSLIGECDYVVITLPLTPSTEGLFDEGLLRAMKPTAYLVNVGRGAIVDEAALIKALKKGWLAGAGLDVFETEPLPADSPLWSLENVILSPHVSGFTAHYDERAVDLFCQNLNRYLVGEPLLNVVDRAAGY